MRRLSLETIVGVLGLGLLVALAFARQSAQNQTPPSTYSTYDVGRNGYRALYEVLLREGVPVRRFERTIGLLDKSVKTLVLASWQTEVNAGMQGVDLESGDVLRLKRFVQGGGRLVVLWESFGDSGDTELGIPKTRDVSTHQASAMLPSGLTTGVRNIAAPMPAAFGFALPKVTPLLANSSGIVAVEFPLGKGEIIAIAGPALFSNAWLGNANNARFAYNVLGTHGLVAFDERVHGYAEDKSFWDALPQQVHVAIFVVLAIIVLGLVGANIRFAPPLNLEPPDERDSSAYLSSMGALLRRARAARHAVATFADDALRRARRRYGLPANSDAAAIAMRAETDRARREIVELDQLRTVQRPSEAVVVRAAAINARLRKDLRTRR